MDTPIRILLADDHSLVRTGLRALFERVPGVVVIAETSDGEETLELIRRERPDIVLIDISMPRLNGFEVIRQVSESIEGVRLIVLSMHESESYVAEALRAGASGYLLKKNASVAELKLAIHCVMEGNRYLTSAISKKVVDGYLHSVNEPFALQILTSRQREILKLIGEGHGTKEIGFKLNISVKTVETHRAELMSRLDIRDVAGLVRYAIKAGIVTLD